MGAKSKNMHACPRFVAQHQYFLRFRSHSGLLYEQIEMEKRKKSKIFEVFHKPRNIYKNRYNFSINIESDLSS